MGSDVKEYRVVRALINDRWVNVAPFLIPRDSDGFIDRQEIERYAGRKMDGLLYASEKYSADIEFYGMSRKRFKKLLMSEGYGRDFAEFIVMKVRKSGSSYASAWVQIKLFGLEIVGGMFK